MAELRFRVKADYEELGKLRTEIQRLKEDLRKTGADTDPVAIKALESQLVTLTRQYEAMTKKIAETEAQYELMAKKMTEKAKEIAKAQDQLAAGPKNEVSPQQGTDAPEVDQSLAAQAKAYEDLKDEIDAIAGSKTNLIKQMLDEQNAIRLINAELKQINAKQKESGTQTQAQKERVTQLNASLLNHKEALSEVRQSLNNYVKLENAASGSMVELSQSLGRMRMVYRTLTEEERNSPFGQELLASIQQADAKIKELDATIGNHQRNVGNYGQAWNGLGNSIQQLARELPALANGPRVFFSAISNNLPILADEIKRARTEYDAMVKKGEKGVPVWKQIGASIFSWQTALTVGITLLTMYGDEIVEWGKKLFSGQKGVTSMAEATKGLNKAMIEGGKEAAKEAVQLKVLEKIATDAKRSDDERDKAARKVLDTLGESITTTNLMKVQNGEYATSIDKVTASLIRQAQAQAAMEKIQEEYKKVIDAESKAITKEAEGVNTKNMAIAGAAWGGMQGYGPKAYSVDMNEAAQAASEGELEKLKKNAEKAQDDFAVWLESFVNKFSFDDIFGETSNAAVNNYIANSLSEIARITQMETDAAKENARAAKDMEFKVWQSRIDAMKGGYAKTMAQKTLDHQKELDSLERQKQDYIDKIVAQEKAIFDAQEDQKAKNDKKYKKRTFDADAVRIRITSTDEVVKQYTKLGEDAAAAYSKAVEEAIKEQDFAKKQQVIDSMSDGDSKERARRLLDNEKELYNLEKQREAYLEAAEAAHILAENKKKAADLDYVIEPFDEEQANADYDVIVENIKRKQYDELADEYMSYIDKKKAIDADYEADKAELENAYLKTGDEKYKRALDERYKAYVQSLNKLEQSMRTADYELIFGDPSKMTSATIEKALDAARKALSELDKDADPEAYKILIEAIQKLENAKLERPFEAWETSALGLTKQLAKVIMMKEQVEKGEREKYDGEFKKAKADLAKGLAGTGVAAFGDALATAAESMKQIAKISGDIDLERQAEALANAGNVISSVASGAASGGWVGAAIGGATSLMNVFTAAVVESKVEAAKVKKAYEDYIEEIARKARQINEDDYDTIFGVRTLEKVIDASEAAKKAMGDFEKAKGALDKDVAPTGRHPQDETRTNQLKSLLSGIYDYEMKNGRSVPIGINLERATALLEAYKDTAEANLDWYKDLEKAVKALEDYEKNLKVVDAYLGSLFSNVGSEIADAIMQGNDALEVLEQNAGKIFKSIAKEMIMSALIGPEFIEKYKNMLNHAMATPNAADDADAIKGFVNELSTNIDKAKETWAEIQRIAEDNKIDMSFDEDSDTQNASRKGYQSLSEDTGNELAGRMLAQYESNLRMEEATRSMKLSVDLMADNQIQIRDIAAESRTLIANSYLELQQIRDNTGAIIKPIQNLSEKMDKWDSKIMDL